ncbi:MAG: tRNA threonylcarbamoyladenosine dehydratase [Bradymonadales bacterium]|jgi:tRNA A37 threonylcarbamoyladenosine dehydratase
MHSTALNRVQQLLGAEALCRLKSSQVLVLGYGAVGSLAAEALCRSGVGTLYIIDADVVEQSNINRQLCAYHSTVGRDKVQVARERLTDINPSARIVCEKTYVSQNNIEEILDLTDFDVVIDAIDSLEAKIAVAQVAMARGIRVLSSMGAARRLDPLQIRVGDISQTTNCPLARRMRHGLRKLGIYKGLRCVYSTEQALSATTQKEQRAKDALGSMMTVTATFGLVLAAEAMKFLLKSS